MWGVDVEGAQDRTVLATDTMPPHGRGADERPHPEHLHGLQRQSHEHHPVPRHELELELEALPSLKKAYLLPKDHALHIPPHVTLSRLEDQVELLAADLRELHHRNYEKDKGKKFEGSYTRVGFIMVITYFTLCGYMIAIGVSDPFLNAIVPTVGFNLSTWSLPWVKQIWMGVYDFNWGRPQESPESPLACLDLSRERQSGGLAGGAGGEARAAVRLRAAGGEAASSSVDHTEV
mmetsp:Transcript_18700/g.31168  ORF Transcript_18700/g.31168 Transcript_18700/m.31168 type:complete len:234 (+) Transcript_18700:83-784(+)|eukprot:CAMPEP_0114427506 /NCGR_PEP_ID=MMETSP0103-20121206/8389_1 /TAXON_ID=37642 ORGANISM="Paraphysomonas imperforata, Strain PA2" /NCGR_SAMPLE_ID=MMETSP0103 /ASSEMBLY_ACC=CAM_ASM_000201 /LENGTH=233 /DNA_ID=CAMNT_0001596581 /DNA_START=134 /DNA_END=835 /DNA_ORIENTATION=+